MLCHQAEVRKLSLNLSQTCGRAPRSPLKVSAVDFLFAVLQQFILAGRDLLRSCCCRKSCCCCCLLPAAVDSCWKKLYFFQLQTFASCLWSSRSLLLLLVLLNSHSPLSFPPWQHWPLCTYLKKTDLASLPFYSKILSFSGSSSPLCLQ